MTLLQCIEDIPKYLQEIKADYSNLKKLAVWQKKYERIIFVGSGTSYNAVNVALDFMQTTCNLTVDLYHPNEFVNHHKHYQPGLYVFISQGGETKLVYQALEKVKQLGFTTVCLSENINSSIAKASDYVIDLKTGKEPYLFRTIGYSNTVVRCFQMAIALGNLDYLEFSNDLQLAIDHLQEIRLNTITWYQKHQFEILQKQLSYFVAEDYLCMVADEADIKFMEMLPQVTRSFELEEFIHGPQNAFNHQITYYLLADQAVNDQKISQIAHYLKDKFQGAYVIGDIAVDENDLTFNYHSTYFKSLEIITAFQTLAYLIATSKGRDLSVSLNKDIQKYINKLL